jgi:hypothetical protein
MEFQVNIKAKTDWTKFSDLKSRGRR